MRKSSSNNSNRQLDIQNMSTFDFFELTPTLLEHYRDDDTSLYNIINQVTSRLSGDFPNLDKIVEKMVEILESRQNHSLKSHLYLSVRDFFMHANYYLDSDNLLLLMKKTYGPDLIDLFNTVHPHIEEIIDNRHYKYIFEAFGADDYKFAKFLLQKRSESLNYNVFATCYSKHIDPNFPAQSDSFDLSGSDFIKSEDFKNILSKYNNHQFYDELFLEILQQNEEAFLSDIDLIKILLEKTTSQIQDYLLDKIIEKKLYTEPELYKTAVRYCYDMNADHLLTLTKEARPDNPLELNDIFYKFEVALDKITTGDKNYKSYDKLSHQIAFEILDKMTEISAGQDFLEEVRKTPGEQDNESLEVEANIRANHIKKNMLERMTKQMSKIDEIAYNRLFSKKITKLLSQIEEENSRSSDSESVKKPDSSISVQNVDRVKQQQLESVDLHQ